MANSLEQTPTPAAEDDEWNYHNCLSCHRRVPMDENPPDLICRHCDNGFLQFEAPTPPSLDPQSEDDALMGSSDYDEEETNNNYSYTYYPRISLTDSFEDNAAASPPQIQNEFNGYDEENEIEEMELIRICREMRNMIHSRWINRVTDSFEDNAAALVRRSSEFSNMIHSRYRSRVLTSNNPQTDFVADDDLGEVLNRLAEADNGRNGAPPAAKSVISGLPTVKILTKADAADCAICQDVIGVGELMKKLPCGHGYHGDCIVTWLGDRNSCPVCRFELPTDDVEYEEMRTSRRKRARTEEISE